jgi:hypothetical protein
MEGQINKNGLIQVKLGTWIDYLKIREWKRRMENGGVVGWTYYEGSLNPTDEQSYEDFCKEVDAKYTNKD